MNITVKTSRNTPPPPRFNKGFTLIELLVVVLIIGVLAAVALPQYTKAVRKSKMTNIMTAGTALRNASNLYKLENGEYPCASEGAYIYDFSVLNIEMPKLSNMDKTFSYFYYNCISIVFQFPIPNVHVFFGLEDGAIVCRALNADKAANDLCSSWGKIDKITGSANDRMYWLSF